MEEEPLQSVSKVNTLILRDNTDEGTNIRNKAMYQNVSDVRTGQLQVQSLSFMRG